MRKGKLLLLALVMCLGLICPISAFAGEKADEEVSFEVEKHKNGFIMPDTWGTSYGTLQKFKSGSAASLPTKYDVRDTLTIPEIRNQGAFGTCWAHAAAACMEINLIKKGQADSTIDLSELQLSYYGYYSVEDTLGLTDGEGYEFVDEGGCFLCNGGNSFMILQPLTRGLQPTDETKTKSLAYSKAYDLHISSTDADGVHTITKLSSGSSKINPTANIIGYKEFDKTDTTGIKNALMKYGAVQISYNADGKYSSNVENSYYCHENVWANHAVTLIGWDDAYPKEKMVNSSGEGPSANGAWIVRNSWGAYNSDGGYFYLSYEDKSFDCVCVYEAEIAAKKTNTYSYNFNYQAGGNSANAWMANIFTAQENAEEKESLYAVGAWVYGQKGEKVKCEVYTNLTLKGKPLSGTLADTVYFDISSDTRSFAYAKLNSPVDIEPGSQFSVVFYGTSTTKVILVGDAQAGQSYIGNDWDFWDLTSYWSGVEFNCEISAYSSVDNNTEYSVLYELNGGINAAGNPTKYYAGFGVASFENPTKTGYDFKGWYANSGLTEKITSIGKKQTGPVTLYAKWEVASYNINYELGGGTNASTNPSAYTYGVGVASFANPTKTGCDFRGWYSDEDLTVEITSISTSQTGPVTIYAKWEAKTYDISYELDGGTNASTNPSTYTYGVGVASFADATREYFDFKGWYSDENLTNKITSISTSQTEAITLYAKWKVASYNINYELGGGTNASTNPSAYTYGVGVASFANPTKTGCDFRGWYSDEDLTVEITSISTSQTGPVTIYAKWEAKTYDISYELDGGTNASTNPSTYTYGVGVASFAAPTKNGYDFKGWYSDVDLTERITSIGIGRIGAVTLYAKWEIPSYSITYELNGGKNAPTNPSTYTYGVGVPSFANPTKTGYDFKGWYSDSKFTQKVTSIGPEKTGKIKLYAKWSGKTYSITYVLNGGKNASANPGKYTYGKGLTSLADATRSGYKFLGWYSDSAFKTKVTSISKTSAKNLKLYAKWQKKEPYSKDYTVSKATYTVKYSAEDKVTAVIFVKTTDTKSKSLSISTVKINGKTLNVTEIAANALKGNKNFTSVTIGSSVKTIGKRAFYSCKNLKKITINTKNLTDKTVGSEAFKGLNAEVKITVPSSKLTAYTKLLKSKGVTGKKQKIIK